jgi:hypothetical protein
MSLGVRSRVVELPATRPRQVKVKPTSLSFTNTTPPIIFPAKQNRSRTVHTVHYSPLHHFIASHQTITPPPFTTPSFHSPPHSLPSTRPRLAPTRIYPSIIHCRTISNLPNNANASNAPNIPALFHRRYHHQNRAAPPPCNSARTSRGPTALKTRLIRLAPHSPLQILQRWRLRRSCCRRMSGRLLRCRLWSMMRVYRRLVFRR